MKWYNTITLDVPLRDVRLNAVTTPQEIEQRRRDGEQAAYERGRQDGEKALGEQLMQQRSELLALHQGVVESLRGAVPKIIQDAERALIDLTLAAAEKIVANLPIAPEMVEAIVRETVAQAEDSAEISIHLNPDDLALLRKHQSPILQGLPEIGPLRFLSSPEVTRGGCIVQTRFGLLDARRETKFDQLRESLSA